MTTTNPYTQVQTHRTPADRGAIIAKARADYYATAPQEMRLASEETVTSAALIAAGLARLSPDEVHNLGVRTEISR